MATRRIDLGTITVEVAEAGGGGRPLLLLHGFTGAKEDFADWWEPLAASGWHVVSPDTRGHGDSDKPEGGEHYSFDLYADDALAVADALGWDRFCVLGHSMGGMFGQLLALAAPDRVRALVLMDTHHGAPAFDTELLQTAAAVALDRGMDVLAGLMAEMQGPMETEAERRLKAERPERVALAERNLRVSSPHMYAASITEIWQQSDRLDRLGALTMPTLVLVGEQDRPFLGASRRMAEAIADAQLAVIPDAGHSPQLEAPEHWWRALTTFLEGVPA